MKPCTRCNWPTKEGLLCYVCSELAHAEASGLNVDYQRAWRARGLGIDVDLMPDFYPVEDTLADVLVLREYKRARPGLKRRMASRGLL